MGQPEPVRRSRHAWTRTRLGATSGWKLLDPRPGQRKIRADQRSNDHTLQPLGRRGAQAGNDRAVKKGHRPEDREGADPRTAFSTGIPGCLTVLTSTPTVTGRGLVVYVRAL